MFLLKKFARQFVFPAITATGFERLLALASSNRLLILAYHGVVRQPMHHISAGPMQAAQFEKHLRYFQQHYEVVSLQTVFDMYRAGEKPKRKTLALTFDDGYENNFTLALPLLKKYNMPATFFIITQCLEDEWRMTWYDFIDLVKNHLDLHRLNLSVIGKPPVQSLADLRMLIKSLPYPERETLFDEIRKQVPVADLLRAYPRELWKLMNAAQIKACADSGLIEIGAHSHHHPNLGLVNESIAEYELLRSRNELENLLQREVVSVAFPDGSYTAAVKDLAEKAGYRNQLAVEYQLAEDKTDKRILSRYCLSSTTTFESNMIQVARAWGR